MNPKLYTDLMTLCNDHEEFFFRDYQLMNNQYKVFDYHFASYTQWLLDGALECRGITFDITDPDNVTIVSRPFKKFFGIGENPFTIDLDLNNVIEVASKADGSMISTVKTPTGFYLKSKGAFFSDQANAANVLIRTPEYTKVCLLIDKYVNCGYTVIMEYCAPDNRIVLSYDKPTLIVLGIRHNITGNHRSIEMFRILDVAVEYFIVHETINAFLNNVPSMQGIEGFVLTFKDGLRVKIKTDAYLALHHLKDSINFPRRLFEACIMEASDDLKAQFHDDPVAIQMIQEMEDKVRSIYRNLTSTVAKFYNDNKKLERKEYAILGQQNLNKGEFSLAMQSYLGKIVDYKAFMIKHYKSYGIKDDDTTDKRI